MVPVRFPFEQFSKRSPAFRACQGKSVEASLSRSLGQDRLT